MKIAEIPERVQEGFHDVLWNFDLWRKQDLRWLNLISQPIDWTLVGDDHAPWTTWKWIRLLNPQKPHTKDDLYLELLKREYANYWKEMLRDDSN